MTQPQPSATAIFYRNLRWLRFVDRFGRKGQQAVEYVGGLAQLVAQTFTGCFTRPFYSSELLRQMDELGVKSVSITGITALFTGMVLALQTRLLARSLRREGLHRTRRVALAGSRARPCA